MHSLEERCEPKDAYIGIQVLPLALIEYDRSLATGGESGLQVEGHR